MTAMSQSRTSLTRQYEMLVLCVSALQLPLSLAERLEFLDDAIEACDRSEELFAPSEPLSANAEP